MSDATAVLERMANVNQSALPPGVLTYHRETKVDHVTLASESECLLPVREKECTDDNAKSSESGSLAALRILLSPRLRRSTLLLWFVFYANSFAYYGLVLLTSQLSDANQSCASGVILGLHQKVTNLYKDTFITSLAGTIYNNSLIFFLPPIMSHMNIPLTHGFKSLQKSQVYFCLLFLLIGLVEKLQCGL